jgi:hypothetical protein
MGWPRCRIFNQFFVYFNPIVVSCDLSRYVGGFLVSKNRKSHIQRIPWSTSRLGAFFIFKNTQPAYPPLIKSNCRAYFWNGDFRVSIDNWDLSHGSNIGAPRGYHRKQPPCYNQGEIKTNAWNFSSCKNIV